MKPYREGALCTHTYTHKLIQSFPTDMRVLHQPLTDVGFSKGRGFCEAPIERGTHKAPIERALCEGPIEMVCGKPL